MATSYHGIIEGFDNSAGYIDFTMTPEPGSPIFPGETVTIAGRINHSGVLDEPWRTFLFELPEAYGGIAFAMPVTVGLKKTVSFEASFALDAARFAAMPRRIEEVQFAYSPSGGYWEETSWAVAVSTYAPDEVDENTHWVPTLTQDLPILLCKYRLNPRILEMDFERATAEGAWADDGQYLQCKALKLSIHPQAVVDDIATAKLVCTGSDGSSREVSLTREQLEAALSPEGYAESEPGIFAGFASALGVDYTLTLTLGDAYDQTSFADTVMRSFARLHLSGAKNGGVAVGMFSSATDDQPKFEVSDTHKTYLYGGASIHGLNEYAPGEHPTGGHWIDGRPIYRFVQDSVVTVATSSATVATLPSEPKDILNFDIMYYRSEWTVYTGNRAYTSFSYITQSNIDHRNVRFSVGSSNDGMSGAHRLIVIVEYTREQDGPIQRPRTAMTANSSQNCVASASTAYSSSYPAWHAFNDNLGDSWGSTKTDADRWIQLQMDVALKNIRVEIYSRNNATPKGPQSGTVEGSNDGSSWTQIGSFSGWDGSQSGALLGTIQCRNTTAYSYVRVKFATWQASSDNTVCIGNMKIFGDYDHYVEAAADPANPEGPEIFDDDPPAAVGQQADLKSPMGISTFNRTKEGSVKS